MFQLIAKAMVHPHIGNNYSLRIMYVNTLRAGLRYIRTSISA